MKQKTILISLIIASSILFLGCFEVDGNFKKIKNDILSSAENKFYRDHEFAIGKAGISLASIAANLDDEKNEAKEILNNLSKIQIGVYKCRDRVKLSDDYSLLQRIDERMKNVGWEYIVKSREDNTLTGIYVKRNDGNKLREFFVISLDKNKLTLIELKGELDKVLSSIIRERKIELSYN